MIAVWLFCGLFRGECKASSAGLPMGKKLFCGLFRGECKAEAPMRLLDRSDGSDMADMSDEMDGMDEACGNGRNQRSAP